MCTAPLPRRERRPTERVIPSPETPRLMRTLGAEQTQCPACAPRVPQRPDLAGGDPQVGEEGAFAPFASDLP